MTLTPSQIGGHRARRRRTFVELNAERAARQEAVIEDLTFMLDTGESVDGAAQRLGMTRASLMKFAGRHGRPDLVDRLKALAPEVGWGSLR